MPSSESTIVNPMAEMSVTEELRASDETDTHPNPYLPSFSRPDFLRKRLFNRASTWSGNKSIKYVYSW
jgi:hypothetical protein